ncbi:MAG: MGMT family protein [bacterium]|nr:MGMT family protein [bacterium]
MQNKSTTFCILKSNLSFNTPFGYLTLEASPKGLSRVKFGKLAGVSGSVFLKEVKNGILNYLRGKKIVLNYPIDISNLTLTQIKVIEELNRIPYGKTISYKELANMVGISSRACGRILASNPFPIIIPCHRVIHANGNLGGYGGGLIWKERLLQLEKNHIE